MSNPTPDFALVTGASSGIGRDLARLLAADGYSLVLVARGREAMESLATELRGAHGVTVHVIPADLSEPASPQRLVDDLRQRGIHVDVLVNNAGFGSNGLFHESDEAGQLAMLAVNVTALTHLTRLLLPPMVARGAGRVMNVASVAGFLPGPLMAVYYASKAYVLSFGEALAAELNGSGVTVTTLCPGVTDTDFHRRAKIENNKLVSGHTMSSPVVARVGYDAMMGGKRLCVPGWRNRLLTVLVRLLPRGAVLAVVKRLNESR